METTNITTTMEQLNQQAQQLARGKEWKRASELYQQSLRANPNQVEVWYQLGRLYYQKQYFAEATQALNQTIKLQPRYFQAYMLLGQALFVQGHVEQALGLYHMIQPWFPTQSTIAERIASLHHACGETDQAAHFCDQALEHFPDSAELIRIWCNSANPAIDAPRIEALKKQCDDPKTDPAFKRKIAFILAKLYAQHQQDETAFAYLRQGNELRFSDDLRSISARMEATDRYMDSIIEVFPETASASEEPALSSHGIRPIFILGMPRSGTSLIEQMLASHPAIYGAGELEYMPTIARHGVCAYTGESYPACMKSLSNDAVKSLAEDYMYQLQSYGNHQTGITHITDKLPQNFLYIGLIRRLLPHALIIHCQRNPMDNCLSIYEQDFSGHHDYAYDLQTIGHYYNRYRDVMAHWQQLWPDHIYTVTYEDVIENPEKQAKALLQYCDIAWDSAVLRFHETKRATRTASASQVTQPIYRSSIDKWKRHEDHLTPLVDMLASSTA